MDPRPGTSRDPTWTPRRPRRPRRARVRARTPTHSRLVPSPPTTSLRARPARKYFTPQQAANIIVSLRGEQDSDDSMEDLGHSDTEPEDLLGDRNEDADLAERSDSESSVSGMSDSQTEERETSPVVSRTRYQLRRRLRTVSGDRSPQVSDEEMEIGADVDVGAVGGDVDVGAVGGDVDVGAVGGDGGVGVGGDGGGVVGGDGGGVGGDGGGGGDDDSDDGGEVFSRWVDGTNFRPNVYDFDDHDSGITDNCPITADSSFLSYFLLFFSRAVMDVVVTETNSYYEYTKNCFPMTPYSRMRRWKDVTAEEMWVFLALTLVMPLVKKHNLLDYWDHRDMLTYVPSFSKFMTRDRYLLLLRFLHFCPRPENQQDPLRKIRIVYEMLKTNYRKYFIPFQKVVIDESLVLFKGRLSFKQYLPAKRHKFGIKIFVLCDCETGMVVDILVYCGKKTDHVDQKDVLGISGSIVKHLLGPFVDSGRLLYTDNWYTSPLLANYLHNRKTGICGTVRKNRKKMPEFPKLKKGDYVRKKSKPVLAMKWRDKRDVHVLSTFHKGNLLSSGKVDRKTGETKYKPDAVLDYNINMRLVDKSDMQIGEVECLRKSVKWYKKLFFHLKDISMLNAFNMFLTKTGNRVLLRDFYHGVAKELLQMYGQPIIALRGARALDGGGLADRLSARGWIGRHYQVELPHEPGKRPLRQCVVCNKSKRKPRKHVRTKWMCKECEVPLCVGVCFMEFHYYKEY